MRKRFSTLFQNYLPMNTTTSRNYVDSVLVKSHYIQSQHKAVMYMYKRELFSAYSPGIHIIPMQEYTMIKQHAEPSIKSTQEDISIQQPEVDHSEQSKPGVQLMFKPKKQKVKKDQNKENKNIKTKTSNIVVPFRTKDYLNKKNCLSFLLNRPCRAEYSLVQQAEYRRYLEPVG